MAVDSLSAYSQTTAATSSQNKSKSASNTLGMDDFFSLMVAQLSNQDMYNTMDNSQFIAQMAQFSMVQALSDQSQISSTAYSVGLIGKEVVLATANDDGSLNNINGIVEGVTLYNGDTRVVVDGQAYPLSSVMIVKEPTIIIPDPKQIDTAQDEETTIEASEEVIVSE